MQLIPVTTARLGEHQPLLDLLPDKNPISWVRNGEGLVGWGCFARQTVSGPNRFQLARKWWHEQLDKLEINNPIHLPGTGPLLFTSFSFDPNEISELIIPEVIVGKRGNNSWITWIGDKPQPKLQTTIGEIKPAEVVWQDLSADSWREKVNRAIGEIQKDRLDKVVLAREILGKSNSEIDPRFVLKNLAMEYPATWVYSNNGLVGATPELLLRLSKSMVVSRILAGTISKTGDDEKDLALAASLARSSKDLEEHEYAVRSVADALSPFCTSTNVPESPFVLHLANVMHLATDVTGALLESHNIIDLFALLEKLHPSAAVCGTPTEIAKEVITEVEGLNRRRYAGPIGWVDSNGDGEQGIALRCGLIDGNQITAFAGCGIVSGSDADREIKESNAKFQAIKQALTF
ncbi:MAG: hypothetical protein RL301_284 [Actinomycetota bacterium]